MKRRNVAKFEPRNVPDECADQSDLHGYISSVGHPAVTADRAGRTSSGKAERHQRRKPAIATGLLALTAIVVSACASWYGGVDVKPSTILSPGTPTAEETRPPTPTTSATVEIAPSPTVEPTPTSPPSSYVEKTPGSFTWTTEAGEVEDVPTVPGLELIPDGNRLIYVAKDGNRYGLGVDGTTEVGSFRTDVFMKAKDGTETQIGGVVLGGQVAKVLIADKLRTIAHPETDAIFPIPVNPDGKTEISFGTFTAIDGTDLSEVAIAFSGKAKVKNIYYSNKQGVTCGPVTRITNVAWFCQDTQAETDAISKLGIFGPTAVSEDPQAQTQVPQTVTEANYPFGGDLLQVSGNVQIATAVMGTNIPVGPGQVLMQGGAAVILR